MSGYRPRATGPGFSGALLAAIVALSMPLLANAQNQAEAAAEPEAWNAHFQSTYVWQKKPAFNSPYQGQNSLIGAREKSYSFTGTAALGLRLGENTEAYFNPEVSQGVALSGLLGLGGFTNGELAKTSGSNPVFYLARLFVRHTIQLGGGSDVVEGDMNQLASRYDKRRVVITAGKLSLLDNFDGNSYAHDPRTQFMNWTLMTHGAFDYAADSRGYTNGVAVEYFHDDWTLRAGRFAQPIQPNGLKLDNDLLKHYGDQLELGRAYSVGSQSGVVRLLAFRSRAVMTRYTDALAVAAATTPASIPTLDSARYSEQVKVGYGVNIEHKLRDDIGIFARAMHADGKTETYAFTEIDRSISAGVSVQGDMWGRHQDTAGLAAASSYISAAHRQYLSLGGTTFFLGDGRLNYRPERIVEAYYSVALDKNFSLTFDYQHIDNPAYNADRGPVSAYAVRLHWEY